MIYRCYKCQRHTFKTWCDRCGDSASESDDGHIPLEPKFFPEFQYQSKGFFKDLLGKRKETAQLTELLDRVLSKYESLRRPYFVNYVHVSNFDPATPESVERRGPRAGGEYTELELFEEVLVRQGFTEIREIPSLLHKLLLATHFNSDYFGFSREASRYAGQTIEEMLRAWISEAGNSFRDDLPLLLYFLWEQEKGISDVHFQTDAAHDRSVPLVADDLMIHYEKIAEGVFFDLLVNRLDTKLEHFDPSKFVTIHVLDAMDGYEFEEFLVKLFRVVGYDVQETPKSGDQGADLFVEKFGKKTVIQAKNYRGNVGNSAIQQALSAKSFFRCDDAMVVTNSYFTTSARDLAAASKVTLIDRNGIQEFLDDYNQQLIESALGSDGDA